MLGPIDVLIAEQMIELRGQHQRTLVGVLATEIGHVVPSSRLIDALWGEYPPMSARTKLQGCVSAVRKSLGNGDWPIITRGAGYVLTANGVTTDLGDHQALLRRAESELDRCHFALASACFRDALDLWRGHAFADASSAVLTGIGNALELLRLLAIERKAACDLALRRNHVVASELALSLASNPLRESMRGMLMLALYRQGSRAQALATYREGRDILRDLVGIEPGPLLRELQTLMLNDDPVLITDSVTRMMADGLVDSNTLPAGTVDIMSTQYAAAAELVARSAAAFVSGVPENPADEGFFGPASVTWRISADISSPVAGLRSLMLQALHPLAMAGVDQHSHWRRDPVGRLAATSQYVTTITYGDRDGARAASAMVRRIHEHVRGTDTITGKDYQAGDPVLLLWVHAALVDSALAAASRIGTPLAPADADRYVAEMVTAAELVGVPPGMTPSDVAGLNAYLDGVRGDLRVTPAAAESISYLLAPEGLDEDVADLWRDVSHAAASSLPDWAREEYGFTEPAPDREDVRAALGMLDILYIGEPGVVEARQRIGARLRAAS